MRPAWAHGRARCSIALTRLKFSSAIRLRNFRDLSGVDRRGRFALIRIPSTKSCRQFLARTRQWLLAHRHWKRRELTVMLRGFYQYFALHHCERKLSWIRYEILQQWKHALQRRGQRRRLSWER